MKSTQILNCIITKHAESRMQQRGIRVEDVAYVFMYGERSSMPGEGDRHYVRAYDIPRHLVSPQQADRLNGLVAVLSDEGHVITAYYKSSHRRDAKPHLNCYSRIRRDSDILAMFQE